MKKSLFILVLTCLFIFSLQNTGLCEKKDFIKFLGLRIGSSGHMFATKVAEAVNQEVHEISVTVVTGSSQENPINVQKKRGQVGFTNADYAKEAFEGIGLYRDKPCQDLRDWFFFVITLDNWLVPADSKIKSIEDLKDKKIVVGPKGYGLSENALATLKVYGLNQEILREHGGNIIYASGRDACRMIQDRVVDAIFAHSGKSSIISYNLPAEETIGLRPLDYDEEKLDEIIRILGRGVKMKIDGGVYKAEPNHINSFGVPHYFVIHKDVPEDLVYKMTKAVFKHEEEIRKTVGQFYNPFKLENALVGANIPVHPGALRYYKERKIVK